MVALFADIKPDSRAFLTLVNIIIRPELLEAMRAQNSANQCANH
jgi:hypothetical protein